MIHHLKKFQCIPHIKINLLPTLVCIHLWCSKYIQLRYWTLCDIDFNLLECGILIVFSPFVYQIITNNHPLLIAFLYLCHNLQHQDQSLYIFLSYLPVYNWLLCFLPPIRGPLAHYHCCKMMGRRGVPSLSGWISLHLLGCTKVPELYEYTQSSHHCLWEGSRGEWMRGVKGR